MSPLPHDRLFYEYAKSHIGLFFHGFIYTGGFRGQYFQAYIFWGYFFVVRYFKWLAKGTDEKKRLLRIIFNNANNFKCIAIRISIVLIYKQL